MLVNNKSTVEDFFEEVKALLRSARGHVATQINAVMVSTYFEIGKRIVEQEQNGAQRAEYGENILNELSDKLTKEFGRGFSTTNLKQMRSFYIAYYHTDTIRQTLSDEFKLSWSHYLKLMRIGDIVDLVFYNRFLRAFVLIDLKIGKLKHQDLGQMQMYVNYYDRFVKTEDENKTIGIILCRDKKDTLVKITLPEDNNQIFASRYQTVLPSKEELKRLIEAKQE